VKFYCQAQSVNWIGLENIAGLMFISLFMLIRSHSSMAPQTTVAPVICNLCNFLLQSGTFPSSLKYAVVTLLLQMPTLDRDTIS
jgi:hypothetical protein